MQPVDTAQPIYRPGARPWLRRSLFWGSAVAVVALDQATKAVIRATLARGESWPDAGWILHLRHVTNTGAAFGILEEQTAFLIMMTFLGLAAIYLYYRYPPFDHGLVAVAIGMMLGGAAGNLADRIRAGEVTDFIDFRWWPAFNVADSAITIGVAVIILGYLMYSGPQHARDDEEHRTHD